jgi:uncharacterized Ntn-hydrolase superfamily protein
VRYVTYSIIARDPQTGELGVAVQSHYFSVGSVVPWAQPGVGAVATQSMIRVDYGPRGLELMAGGLSAPDALTQLRDRDEGADSRQVAMIDATGAVGAFTGPACLAAAGDVQGDGVSCQGNILFDESVWPAMLEGFMSESGPLAGRLLVALQAAQAAGGDLRGVQSAALLVVPGGGESWETVVSLRAEDSADPLGELGRLLALHDAYELVSEGDEHLVGGRHAAASDAYRRAVPLAPDQPEVRFWGALALAIVGDRDGALAQLRPLCSEAPQWREVLGRLPPEFAPGVAALRERLD